MKRFLSCLVFAAVALMLPAHAGAAKPKVMKIAHMTNEAYHMHRAMVQFQNELNATGKFKVEIYPSAQFGPDTEAIETTKSGDLDMTVSPSSYFTDEAASIALIELPYVFNSRLNAIKTLDGPWGQEQLGKLEPAGLYGVGYLENGHRHLSNSRRAVRLPSDMKGLKMRTMPVPAHVYYWNSLGCSAEGSPFSELYTNLATKVFDGQENGIAHTYTSKLNEVQRYMTLSGHVYTTYILAMNADYWNSLSAEEKELVKKAHAKAYAYQLALIEKEDQANLDEMKGNKNHPFEVIELTAEEHKAFMDSAKPTHEKYRKELGEAEFDAFLKAIREADAK